MSDDQISMPPAEGWMGRVDQVAAPKVGFDPATWRTFIYTKADQGGVYVTGAVCPPILRGPRKGEPNFRKHDKATRRVVYLSSEECE